MDRPEDSSSSEIEDRFASAFTDLMPMIQHELRAPLGLIVTLARVASSDPDIELVAERLASIARVASRAMGTANELLDAPAESGSLTSLAASDVSDLIERLVEDLAQAHDVRLTIEPIASELVVITSVRRLETVLQSLIANALDHHGAGTPIEVRVGSSGGRITIAVANAIARLDSHRGQRFGNRIVDLLCLAGGYDINRDGSAGRYSATLSLPRFEEGTNVPIDVTS